ncbi:MAG: hypothetical protein AAGJ10_08930 [Bacteroidota bacterium]
MHLKVREIDTRDWPERVGHPEFLELLERHLPDVSAQVDQCDLELLHMVMGQFESSARDAYGQRLSVAKRYFDFANQVLVRAEADVLGALKVSFIEGFVLGSEDEQTARSWMPEELQQAYDAYQTWYQELLAKKGSG